MILENNKNQQIEYQKARVISNHKNEVRILIKDKMPKDKFITDKMTAVFVEDEEVTIYEGEPYFESAFVDDSDLYILHLDNNEGKKE